MISRPHIKVEIKREVLFESRHRCAVCCYPITLEIAHIVPWRETKEHTLENLIALCPNCHSVADKENWGASYLRRYKESPCAVTSNSLPPLTPSQKYLVDLIISTDPDKLSVKERQRLLSMVAAYVDISLNTIEVSDVRRFNSSLVTIKMPREGALELYNAYKSGDDELWEMLDGIHLISVRAPRPEGSRKREDDLGRREIMISVKDHLGDDFMGQAYGVTVLTNEYFEFDLSWDMTDPHCGGFIIFTLVYRDEYWNEAGRYQTEQDPFYDGRGKSKRKFKLNFGETIKDVQISATFMPFAL